MSACTEILMTFQSKSALVVYEYELGSLQSNF